MRNDYNSERQKESSSLFLKHTLLLQPLIHTLEQTHMHAHTFLSSHVQLTTLHSIQYMEQ